MPERERRLAAIMFTDMVGYAALGQENESLSLALVEEQRRLLRPVIKRHNGREVKTMGDAFLVEFANALDAVRCAYDAQRSTREFNISQPNEQRIRLRIGLHLGDVVRSKGDISGDAVNIASRIQSLADAGGVCITRTIYDLVQNKFELSLKSLGAKPLKNITVPVEVYKMVMPWESEQTARVDQLDPSRVAVLPFANMSPDPSDSYFADGIAEEIISTLSNVGGLSVISRTSAMGYKGTTKNIREIGKELGAGSVLEGSFRKYGSKIRVTTQLVSADNDRHIWAQSYDANLDDVIELQIDIARQVADSLKVKILTSEMNRIDRKPTDSAKAFTLYLRGRYHWNRRGMEDIKKASEYFEEAVREDTKFALGYVGLADSYQLLSGNWGVDTVANRERAEVALAKALELDRDLAEAHATQGLLLFDHYKLKEAEEEFKNAIRLKPSYASAHQWYGHLLLSQVRWDEAFKHIEKAVELDPFSQMINFNHSYYYYRKRDYRKALELVKKAAELDPNNIQAHLRLLEVYGKMKMLDDARHEAEVAAGIAKESYPAMLPSIKAMIAYHEDDKERVRRLLPELEAHIGEPAGPEALEIAELYFYLDEINKAFDWLEKSYLRKDYFLNFIKTDEFLDRAREDTRYQNLLKRIGLA